MADTAKCNLTFPQRFYLCFVACPEAYRDMCPEHTVVSWCHLLWIFIPIAGIIGFYQSVKGTYDRSK